jgi:hypothetical protein
VITVSLGGLLVADDISTGGGFVVPLGVLTLALLGGDANH